MTAAIDWDGLEPEIREALAGLAGLDVDRERVERFSAALAGGKLGPESNRLPAHPEPPAAGDLDDLDALSRAERGRLAAAGRAALERGEVAVAVLNGGMATRFGGAVKGIVEALEGRSFLEIKLAQARRFGTPPFLCMTSFATHLASLAFLEERGLAASARCFLQAVSLRLTPEGQPFRGADGRVSLYAPGHGDFPEALRRSGLLARLRGDGVRTVLLSNVDNLGADPDPLVVGYHLAHGRAMTVEAARTLPGDVGGAPMRVSGRLQVIEGFRFPEGFDFERLPWVNTNTFAFSLDALDADFPLSWFYVERTVDGRRAIQMEHLVGELSAFVETAYVGVPRLGPQSRFLPVKTREDLAALRADPALVRRFTRL